MGNDDYRSIKAIDLDGDQDVDLLISQDDKIQWLENLDGAFDFADPRTIVADEIRDFSPADVDNDGDMDLLVTHISGPLLPEGRVSWYENDGVSCYMYQAKVWKSVSTASHKRLI
ncbi:MAG: VCBS repeat-containing protein [Pirellulaceae bacterium]